MSDIGLLEILLMLILLAIVAVAVLLSVHIYRTSPPSHEMSPPSEGDVPTHYNPGNPTPRSR